MIRRLTTAALLLVALLTISGAVPGLIENSAFACPAGASDCYTVPAHGPVMACSRPDCG